MDRNHLDTAALAASARPVPAARASWPRAAKPALAAGLALACVLGTAGCSSGANASPGTGSTTSARQAQPDAGAPATPSPSPGASGEARFPVVFGEIAEADDGMLQVQDGTSQTSVTYTAGTVITQQVSGKVNDIKTGMCVMATDASTTPDTAMPSAPPAASSGDQAGANPAPSAAAGEANPQGAMPEPSTPSQITATQITLSEAVNGACTSFRRGQGAGAGAPGGGSQSGTTSQNGPATQGGPDGQGAPQAMPSAMPSGRPGGMFALGRAVMGIVTAIDGGTITVKVTGTSGTTSTSTVTTTAATKVTTTAKATSAALKQGQCVAASGTQDQAGTIAATTLQVSAPASEGGCKATTMRMGRLGGANSRGATSSNTGT